MAIPNIQLIIKTEKNRSGLRLEAELGAQQTTHSSEPSVGSTQASYASRGLTFPHRMLTTKNQKTQIPHRQFLLLQPKMINTHLVSLSSFYNTRRVRYINHKDNRFLSRFPSISGCFFWIQSGLGLFIRSKSGWVCPLNTLKSLKGMTHLRKRSTLVWKLLMSFPILRTPFWESM